VDRKNLLVRSPFELTFRPRSAVADAIFLAFDAVVRLLTRTTCRSALSTWLGTAPTRLATISGWRQTW